MENLKSIRVKIFYDENLKKITGKDFEEAIVKGLFPGRLVFC